MKRVVQMAQFKKWVVWEDPRRLDGRTFDSKEEAEAFEKESGGMLEYIGDVYPDA